MKNILTYFGCTLPNFKKINKAKVAILYIVMNILVYLFKHFGDIKSIKIVAIYCLSLVMNLCSVFQRLGCIFPKKSSLKEKYYVNAT